MATTIQGIHGRKLSIDGDNRHQPESFFITGPRAFTFEVDREVFREAVCRELGLVPVEQAILPLSAA